MYVSYYLITFYRLSGGVIRICMYLSVHICLFFVVKWMHMILSSSNVVGFDLLCQVQTPKTSFCTGEHGEKGTAGREFCARCKN